jgi:hypothetical protein
LTDTKFQPSTQAGCVVTPDPFGPVGQMSGATELAPEAGVYRRRRECLPAHYDGATASRRRQLFIATVVVSGVTPVDPRP